MIGIFLLANIVYMWAAHGPLIASASVDPVKVRPGDSMLISAQISDPSGVSSVSAYVGGIEAAFFISMARYTGWWAHG